MRKLFILLLLIPALSSAAPGVSFDFASVPVGVFAQSVFKGLLHRDYVMAPELQGAERKISVSVANLNADQVPAFVDGVLLQQGISTTLKDGIYYLGASSKSMDARPVVDAAVSLPAALSSSLAGVTVEPVDVRAMSAPGRGVDDESMVYVAVNRPTDFLAGVVSGAFGARSVVVAGGNLVLTGSKAQLKKMVALLDAVDSMPKLVDVSASWVEVADSSGSARGISLLASVLGAKLGVNIGTVNSGSSISLRNTSFQLVVDALDSDGRFKQVSNSRVTGDDYRQLVLTVGDETPTISSTGKDNAGNSIQNVVYRPSGVIVDVLPKVLGNGRIQLAVDGQISSFKATSTGVIGSPTLIKRQVKTMVTVGDGDVLLIGGLNDTQTTTASSGFSFLPSSWSVKSGSQTKTDLVLVLSAKVVASD